MGAAGSEPVTAGPQDGLVAEPECFWPREVWRSFLRKYRRRHMQAPIQIPAMPTTRMTSMMTHCQWLESLIPQVSIRDSAVGRDKIVLENLPVAAAAAADSAIARTCSACCASAGRSSCLGCVCCLDVAEIGEPASNRAHAFGIARAGIVTYSGSSRREGCDLAISAEALSVDLGVGLGYGWRNTSTVGIPQRLTLNSTSRELADIGKGHDGIRETSCGATASVRYMQATTGSSSSSQKETSYPF